MTDTDTRKQTWTTEDEKNFIDKLGMFLPDNKHLWNKGRVLLLRNYIDAFEQRSRWDDTVDPGAVLEYAEAALAKELA